jgi:hypothetical protein
MRRLKSPQGAIPRAYPDHRRADALRYRSYCLAILAQLGPLPAAALTTLREAGRAAVELGRLSDDLETARRRSRRTDMARARKAAFMLREQLVRLERRLEELAGPRQSDPLADVRRAVEEANRR